MTDFRLKYMIPFQVRKDEPMYICAADIGTTTIKASIFNEDGVLLSTASEGYPLLTSFGGAVEQDARLWYELTVKLIRKCVSSLPKTDKAYLSVSAQGGSIVPIDEKGEPMSLAATWMDGRGEEYIKDIYRLHDKKWFYERTGKLPVKSCCIAKLKLFGKAAMYLTTLEYVNMKLTGNAVTDPTSAAMTYFYDLEHGDWQEEILDICGIRKSQLARIMMSGAVVDKLTPQAAADSGLPEDTTVINGAHDQYIAAAGANVLKPGDILLSTGTAWVVFGASDKRRSYSELSIGPHVVSGMYGVFSSVPTGGAALDWARDKLLSGVAFDVLDAQVMSRIGKNKRLLVYPSFSSREARICGLELSMDGFDIALAVMEGVIFEVRCIFERFISEGYLPASDISIYRSGMSTLKMIGGAVKGKPWQTLVNAILGDVSIFDDPNVTLIGAAVFAGTAADLWGSYEEGSKRLCRSRPVEALSSLREFYDEKFEKYKSMR